MNEQEDNTIVIYFKDNKFLKGLVPLEWSFYSSDVGNKNKSPQNTSRRNIGDTIPLNVASEDESINLYKGMANCFDL